MSMKMFECVLLAALLAWPLTTTQAAPPTETPAKTPAAAEIVVINNAKIALGDGKLIERGAIKIEKGRFTEIKEGTITAPAGALSLDVGGKLITPGLIAAETQLGIVEIGLEDSTHDDVRSDPHAIKAGYVPAAAVNADSSLLAVQAVEGVTTAAVSPVGGLLSGQVSWIDLLPGAHGELVAKDSVAVVGALGRVVEGSRAASLTELQKAFEDARWYRANQRQFDRGEARELVAHPLDLRALWPVIDRQVPLIVRAHRASDLLALIELGKTENIRITIVGAAEGWKVADELAAAKIPVIVQPTQNLPGSFDMLGARLDNAALLAKAGVSVAIAHFDTHNVRNMTQEAGIAVANGLDPQLALRALTLEVAKAYGMDKDYGSIAVGKVANLVVWDGDDPLELSTWAAQVFVRGQPLTMRSRQTELFERYQDLGRFEP